MTDEQAANVISGFPQRLLDTMQVRNLRPVDVWKKLDVTANTLMHWRSGKHYPSLLQIVRLAAVLEVSPGWLAFGEK